MRNCVTKQRDIFAQRKEGRTLTLHRLLSIPDILREVLMSHLKKSTGGKL